MTIIQLTRGQVAFIDDEDAEAVNKHKWTAVKSSHGKTWYAHRHAKINGKWKHLRMHRFLMNAPQNMKIDHRDGNGINNVKSNLRLCTHAQNLMNMRCHNKHGLKGITFVPARRIKKWMTKIHINGKVKTVGYFASKFLAAKAYNEMAKKHFGEFARLNPI
jgi:hypothetical protein